MILLKMTGEVDRCEVVHVKFSRDLTYEKLLKSVNFWQSYSKNKQVDIVGTQCMYRVECRTMVADLRSHSQRHCDFPNEEFKYYLHFTQ